MEITNARFVADATIEADVDGKKVYVPVDPLNMVYNELVEKGVPVAPAGPPPSPQLTTDELLEGLIAEGVIKAGETAESFKAKYKKA